MKNAHYMIYVGKNKYRWRWSLIIILTFILISSSAQATPLKHWGFKAGYTGATQIWEFDWDYEWINVKNIGWRSGFHVGIYTEWFDYRNFRLIIGLNYEQKGFEYKHAYTGNLTTTLYSYFSFPVLVKYAVKMRKFNPYILAGPRIDIFTMGLPLILPLSERNWGVESRFRKDVYGLSVGGGIELPSMSSRSIFVEIVYNYDPSYMCDINQPGPGKEVRIKNESFNLSFGIGF